jgi:hypothetical protein
MTKMTLDVLLMVPVLQNDEYVVLFEHFQTTLSVVFQTHASFGHLIVYSIPFFDLYLTSYIPYTIF